MKPQSSEMKNDWLETTDAKILGLPDVCLEMTGLGEIYY